MTFRNLLEKNQTLIAVQVNSKDYHKELNKLPKDKRAFVDEKVEADEYYLAEENDKVVGGFGVNYNGYITGVFALASGKGKDVMELDLKIAKEKLKSGKLNLFCIGDFLRDFYKKYGFKVTETIKWDDQYAPKNWDYKKYGRPDLYEMSL